MITVKDTPDIFSPVHNPIIWEFGSLVAVVNPNAPIQFVKNQNLVYFLIKVFIGNNLVHVEKAYVAPDNIGYAYVNLSKILGNYVGSEFIPYSSTFVDYLQKPVIGYRLVATEFTLDLLGENIIEADTYTTNVFYAFDAKLDRISNRYFKSTRYALKNTNNTPISFLTTKPDKAKVNIQSEEGLYYLNNEYLGTPVASYLFYDKTGLQVGQHNEPSPATVNDKMQRINVCPAYLASNVAGLDFSVVNHIEVFLADSLSSSVLSEKRIFVVKDVLCHLRPVNIYWTNEWGGIDSFQFYLSETKNSVNRTTIKTNTVSRNSADRLRDYDGALFNESERVIDYTVEQTITVNTLDLSDAESKWLASIVNAKSIWIKEGEDSYLPVSLVENDYSIVKKNTIQGINMKQFDFRLADGIDLDYVMNKSNTIPAVIGGTNADFYNY